MIFVLFEVVNWSNELKQAAFRAFASLGANDEEIRKKVNGFSSFDEKLFYIEFQLLNFVNQFFTMFEIVCYIENIMHLICGI